jgi:uncharacterized repeat protein (TIGR02543 family)
MATVSKWTPFGVALDITATGGAVTRTSATKFTVKINASWETYYNGASTKYGMVASSGGSSVTLKTFSNTAASSGSGSFTGTYSISGNGSATKTITVTFRNFNDDNGDSATKSVSFNVSVPAWTSYTITYNANGGTGAPGSQTKWKDQTLTLSSTKPTRTGYSFLGWSASSSATSATYSAGGSYTANSAATLYAVWKANTYTVKYNANGGSGAPSNQTKTYGVTLTLSSTKPTRTNYNFKGWGTSASATTVAYAAGASYTANAAVTLYAIWELAYTKPRITNLSIPRCNSEGTVDENGTYALISFNWACDKTLSSITAKFESESTGSTTYSISASGTSGSVSEVVGGGSLSTETTYSITIIVADTIDSTYVFGTLAGTKFVIDFKSGGTGAAFGKPAELDNVLDIGFQTRHFGGLLPVVLDPETDLNNIQTPNTYTGANIADYNYGNCPVASGTFTLIVESCGEDGQIRQTYINCSKVRPERYVRFYYQSAWGSWLWAGTEEYVLYENSSGSSGTITLNANLSQYRYIEIYFTDNNGKSGGYTKVWSPNGKAICLHISEASSTTSIFSRQTTYALKDTSITPSTTSAGYIQFNPSEKTISNAVTGTNYIKIVRVIGRA